MFFVAPATNASIHATPLNLSINLLFKKKRKNYIICKKNVYKLSNIFSLKLQEFYLKRAP